MSDTISAYQEARGRYPYAKGSSNRSIEYFREGHGFRNSSITSILEETLDALVEGKASQVLLNLQKAFILLTFLHSVSCKTNFLLEFRREKEFRI